MPPGGAVLSGLVLISGAAWFLMPAIAPGLTCTWCPWLPPTLRAATIMESIEPGTGVDALARWTWKNDGRAAALAARLKSLNPADRGMVVAAFDEVAMTGEPPAVDAWLLEILKDPSGPIRAMAAMALSDVGSIPALEAMADDPDKRVHRAVAGALKRLRLKHHP